MRAAPTCAGVRHDARSDPEHCSEPGSNEQCLWIFDQPIGDAVARVARGDGALVEQRQFRIGQPCRLVFQRGRRREQVARRQARPDIGGRARDNAVVVGRIPLRFHQPLSSAGRTTNEVREPRAAAVEGLDDALGLDGRFVNGTIPEVDDEFGMAQRPRSSRRRVASVGRRRRVAAIEGRRHRAVADHAGKAAAAHRLELAVPSADGHPHLEVDGRLDAAEDAARRSNRDWPRGRGAR